MVNSMMYCEFQKGIRRCKSSHSSVWQHFISLSFLVSYWTPWSLDQTLNTTTYYYMTFIVRNVMQELTLYSTGSFSKVIWSWNIIFEPRVDSVSKFFFLVSPRTPWPLDWVKIQLGHAAYNRRAAIKGELGLEPQKPEQKKCDEHSHDLGCHHTVPGTSLLRKLDSVSKDDRIVIFWKCGL